MEKTFAADIDCYAILGLVRPPLHKLYSEKEKRTQRKNDNDETVDPSPVDTQKRGIRAAYLRKALLLHPDKNPADPVAAAAELMRVQHAYAVLSDPLRRAEHDAFWRTHSEQEERLGRMGAEKRRMRSDLEAREGAADAAKRRKRADIAAASCRLAEIERIRFENDRTLREEARDLHTRSMMAESLTSQPSNCLDSIPERTIKCKWQPKHMTLTESTLRTLVLPYGPVTDVLVVCKPGSKYATGVVLLESKAIAQEIILAARLNAANKNHSLYGLDIGPISSQS